MLDLGQRDSISYPEAWDLITLTIIVFAYEAATVIIKKLSNPFKKAALIFVSMNFHSS